MTPQLLARYADRPLPRYTSYPTAPHFSPAFGDADYREWLAALPADEPVSLYLHVPFCRAMCWYCGCNTSVTRREAPVDRYLQALDTEMAMVAAAIPFRPTASFVHFGGGTPTLMRPEQFAVIMDRIRSGFDVAKGAEVAIEIDPRTLQPAMVEALARSGVTRASLGVQSFDPLVQRAINRVQSFGQTRLAVARLRSAGIGGINFDLIYGLPWQSVASCIETVHQAVTLQPDRLSVFGYAHVPSFKPHQRKIDEAVLPDGRERHRQAEAIAQTLRDSGYVQVGLDHFARPGDALAKAQEQGTLHRNFQGYTTDGCETLIGFGASSIGRLPQGYVQNATTTSDYQKRIGAGLLAASKGRAFAGEDRLRAAIIERVMCHYSVDVGAVCRHFSSDPEAMFRTAAAKLEPLLADGVAKREGETVRVAEGAEPLVRVLASAFDEYLGQGTARHSRAV